MTCEQHTPPVLLPATESPEVQLHSIPAGAKLIGVHPTTLRRWLSEGVLVGYRIGKSTLRVDLASLKVQQIGASA